MSSVNVDSRSAAGASAAKAPVDAHTMSRTDDIVIGLGVRTSGKFQTAGSIFVDGVLGAIASRTYGPAAPWPFWLSVTRGGLAVLAGLALLFSQFIVSVVQPAFLATCIGVGAIVDRMTAEFPAA